MAASSVISKAWLPSSVQALSAVLVAAILSQWAVQLSLALAHQAIDLEVGVGASETFSSLVSVDRLDCLDTPGPRPGDLDPCPSCQVRTDGCRKLGFKVDYKEPSSFPHRIASPSAARYHSFFVPNCRHSFFTSTPETIAKMKATTVILSAASLAVVSALVKHQKALSLGLD